MAGTSVSPHRRVSRRASPQVRQCLCGLRPFVVPATRQAARQLSPHKILPRPSSTRLEADRHGCGTVGDRLSRGGRGRDGHGLHRRPDRSCGCARHARRPSPRGERPLAGRLPIRPAPSGVVVLRRRVDGARSRRRAGPRSGGGAPGTGPSVGDPGLLRRHPASPLHRLGPRHLPRRPASITPTAPRIS